MNPSFLKTFIIDLQGSNLSVDSSQASGNRQLLIIFAFVTIIEIIMTRWMMKCELFHVLARYWAIKNIFFIFYDNANNNKYEEINSIIVCRLRWIPTRSDTFHIKNKMKRCYLHFFALVYYNNFQVSLLHK